MSFCRCCFSFICNADDIGDADFITPPFLFECLNYLLTRPIHCVFELNQIAQERCYIQLKSVTVLSWILLYIDILRKNISIFFPINVEIFYGEIVDIESYLRQSYIGTAMTDLVWEFSKSTIFPLNISIFNSNIESPIFTQYQYI